MGRTEGFCRTHHNNCYDKLDDESGKLLLYQDFAENRQRIMGGKKIYFSSTLPADIFHTYKYLPEAFARGQMLLAFDLTPDKMPILSHHAGVPGNLELDLTFCSASKRPLTLISYAIYNAAISIDSNLQVTKVNY